MLDNTNKLPLYVQLVNTLLEQIQNDMSPNDKLPTEKEIEGIFIVFREKGLLFLPLKKIQLILFLTLISERIMKV